MTFEERNAPAEAATPDQSPSEMILNDSNTYQTLGQIFGLIQQANELIPSEEMGCGYTFTMNRIEICLHYHYMHPESSIVYLLEADPRKCDLKKTFEEVICILRDQLVMRRAGLICGMY